MFRHHIDGPHHHRDPDDTLHVHLPVDLLPGARRDVRARLPLTVRSPPGVRRQLRLHPATHGRRLRHTQVQSRLCLRRVLRMHAHQGSYNPQTVQWHDSKD